MGRGTPSGWSATRYIDFVSGTPGLADLAQSPFVARVMADALPVLEAQAVASSSSSSLSSQSSSSQSSTRRITRADVYAAFVGQCWEAEARRLAVCWPPGLPHDFDVGRSLTNYCTDLAVEMFAQGQARSAAFRVVLT